MDALLRRREMMNQNRLPFDSYVEYITNNNGLGAYIDTGINPKNNYRFILGVQGITTPSFIVGVRKGIGDTMFYMQANVVNNNSGAYFGLGNTSQFAVGGVNDSDWHSIGLLGNDKMVLIDGVTKATWQTVSTFTSQHSIHLFGINNNGTHTDASVVFKVRSLSLWDGGTKILDLKPVRVGQVGAMYDTMSETLFMNAGTGSFGVGNDINY